MLWDVSSRTKLGVLRGHVGAVRAVAYSPGGETLATAADDGTARLWHVATQQELCILARCSVPLIWVRFLSPYQLAAGTSPYGSNPPGNNDVLVFDAREHSRSFGVRIQSDEPESRRLTYD
jgi:WD40 repeat protein